MLPTAYPFSLERLDEAWHCFMENGRIAPEMAAQLDPAVLQSWRRCISRLAPYTRPRPRTIGDEALRRMQHRNADLISLSTPYLEDIHQFTEGSDTVIVLADGAGCLLAAVGDSQGLNVMERFHLGPGTYWAEGQLGTNALALALQEAMPVQVVGPEHYCRRYHPFATTAAPVHDLNGRICGVIGIIGAARTVTSHDLALVLTTSRALENQLHVSHYLDEVNHNLTTVKEIVGSITDGVIAWDATGRIQHVNELAAHMLGLRSTNVVGRTLKDAVALPAAVRLAVAEQRELEDVEVTFGREHGGVSCLLSLRLMQSGAQKEPIGYLTILRPIEQVRRLVRQQVGAEATITLDDFFSEAPAMRRILRQARIAARGTSPVVLRGEDGVGKNALAHALHNASSHADGPFLAVNCQAIPHELMLPEFLGNEKTSESRGRPSKFELAHQGTLALYQIDNLSLETQSALLHVLDYGHLMRLDGTYTIPVNVRLIATTSSSLEQRVAEGNFLPELLNRFAIFSLEVPPLRHRIEDLPLLAERFLANLTAKGETARWLDDDALDVLKRYPWPGNVRQLEQVLERALHQSEDNVIHVADLPEAVRRRYVLNAERGVPQPVLTAAEAEREAIIRAGWSCRGRVTDMAQQLGMGRTTLWRKLKRYQIDTGKFRAS